MSQWSVLLIIMSTIGFAAFGYILKRYKQSKKHRLIGVNAFSFATATLTLFLATVHLYLAAVLAFIFLGFTLGKELKKIDGLRMKKKD